MHARGSGFPNSIIVIGLLASDVIAAGYISLHSLGENYVLAEGCVADVLRRLYHTQVRAREAGRQSVALHGGEKVCVRECVCALQKANRVQIDVYSFIGVIRACGAVTVLNPLQNGTENGSKQIILAEQPSEVKHGVLPVGRSEGAKENKSRN